MIEVKNIFIDNPIYYPSDFNWVKENLHSKIRASSFVSTRVAGDNGFAVVLKKCLAELVNYYSAQTKLIAFCAQNGFMENTVVARSKLYGEAMIYF